MIDVPDELLSFLKTEYDRCQDTVLQQERETAIDRYNGEPYGDEEDGSSQVVSRATAETIDYMVPSILRTIVSGERVVEFVHRNSEKAHEATETIMHLLMDEQDGYTFTHDWLKSGLLEKNAVSMAYAEPGRPKRQLMQGVSAPALQLLQQRGFKIVQAEQTGQDEDGPVFLVAAIEEQPIKFCASAVPNEEFYCSPDARTIDEAPLKGRRVRKSLSDLIALGYPRDEVESISSDGYYNDIVANSRDEKRYTEDSIRQGLARRVWWHEDYVTYDLNDDGIAELLYVQRSADFKIFAITELEDECDHPFEDWCPYPMPHRRVGQSLFDKTGDLERIDTVILRQTLNGIYLSNNPSTYLHEDSIGENTIEDILTVKSGRVVRWKGSQPPVERQGVFNPEIGFSALEFIERRRETRTGITRLNQGLDEDTLNQTAKGQAQLIARGEQQEEYIARNFANAFAKFITKLARLLQRHGKPIWVPIDGKYQMVDPQQWPEDMIARARMGLGAVNKDQRVAGRREIIGMQSAALQAGLPIVDADKFFNSAKGMVNEFGLGDVTEFFNEPPKDANGNPIPQQPKPDPEMAKAQAQIAQLQAKHALDQQTAAARMQAEQVKTQAHIQMMQQQGAQQAQIDAAKMQSDANIQQMRMVSEAQLAEQQMQIDAALQVHKINTDAHVKAGAAVLQAHVQKFRQGGQLNK